MVVTVPDGGDGAGGLPSAPRGVTVLGATGSVGTSTLDLIGRHPDRFRVEALTADRNAEALAAQARRVGARLAVVADPDAYGELKAALAGSGIEAAAGPDALVEAAQRPAEWVMAAIVGSAGLAPTLAAARRGAMVAFANKECLVSAGPLMIDVVRRCGAKLLPVDSEHNAIFQVLADAANTAAVERLVLTASGGPFRTLAPEAMRAMTPEQAVAHPTWDMGAKISVDSATMMNKGLEIIEASYLFAMPSERVDVVIHPQSVVHSLVEFVDGSVLAQLGAPDMRTPIAYCLAWPERMPTPAQRLDLAAVGRLDFEPPSEARFPALKLARDALAAGGSAPTVLNAANEVAVRAFLDRRIGFLDIAEVVARTLDRIAVRPLESLDDVTDMDGVARRTAGEAVAEATSTV
jgi:1-deoxy-D-xylulose-5-phosphate reductoisomerase